MISFERYAEFLTRSAATSEVVIHASLARIGGHAKTMAAEYIGHELPQWRPLAASTIAQKERLGFTGHVSATDPLLRTGGMRDSIVSEVSGHEVVVGSDDQKAVWQELGTSRIPPRPFLALAMSNATEYAGEVFGEAALAMLIPPEARR